MSIEVKVPQLPESVADATLVAWHKKAGDAVRREENLVDLETDKVVLEVPAPADGVIKRDRRRRRRRRDERPAARDSRARQRRGAAAAPARSGSGAGGREAAAAEGCTAAARGDGRAAPRARAAPAATAPAAAAAAAAALVGVRQQDGPAVRKLVEEHDLDPGAIAGSGREGRITKGDVLDYIADHQATTVGIEHDVLSRAGVAAAGAARRRPAGCRATSTASR